MSCLFPGVREGIGIWDFSEEVWGGLTLKGQVGKLESFLMSKEYFPCLRSNFSRCAAKVGAPGFPLRRRPPQLSVGSPSVAGFFCYLLFLLHTFRQEGLDV